MVDQRTIRALDANEKISEKFAVQFTVVRWSDNKQTRSSIIRLNFSNVVNVVIDRSPSWFDRSATRAIYYVLSFSSFSSGKSSGDFHLAIPVGNNNSGLSPSFSPIILAGIVPPNYYMYSRRQPVPVLRSRVSVICTLVSRLFSLSTRYAISVGRRSSRICNYSIYL